MESTSERIIAATGELFGIHGFHGTALKQVSAASGAPTGSLYHFFPGGKLELAEAVLRETGAAYLQGFELIADESDDPVRAVVDLFDGAADALETGGFVDVCPIGTVARETASTHERLRVAADDVFGSWVEGIAARLTGWGVPTGDAGELATTVVAALEGCFVLARTRRDADILRRTGRHVAELVAPRLRPAPEPRSADRRA